MKSLVFPRIFLHCVALGFIVSGLLLSVGPEVQILSGTPESTAASLFSGLAAFLFSPSPGNFASVTGRFLYAASFFVMALDSARTHCLQFGGGLSHAGCGTI